MRKHILVVEDYDPVRELTAAMLEDRGYRVSTVADGAVMRNFLKTADRVDATVLDLQLPGESGASLARYVKGLGLPVVVISGSHGALDFAAENGLPLVHKPFRAEELYLALDRAFGSGEFGPRKD